MFQIVGFADDRISWLGRRLVFIVSMGTCIIVVASLFFLNRGGMKGTYLYFALYIAAYNSISVSWEPNYLSAAELMPTEIRAKTTAILNIITRVGNILAAKTIGKYKGEYEGTIFIVVLSSCIFSFIITFLFLKETKNIRLDSVTTVTTKESRGAEEGEKSSAEEASKSSEVSRSPTEGTLKSKEGSKKDAPRGSIDQMKDTEDDRKSDEQRSRSKEEAVFNKLDAVNAAPLKPVEGSSGQEKVTSKDELKKSKEELKESKEDSKESKEGPREGEDKREEAVKGSQEKASDDKAI